MQNALARPVAAGWSKWAYNSAFYLAALAVVLLLLCTLWFLANLALLSTWAVAVWNVEEGARIQGAVLAAANATAPAQALAAANGAICPARECGDCAAALLPTREAT